MFQYFSNINLRKCAQDTVTEFAMHDAVFVSYHGGFCYDNCGCVTYALCLISALFFSIRYKLYNVKTPGICLN